MDVIGLLGAVVEDGIVISTGLLEVCLDVTSDETTFARDSVFVSGFPTHRGNFLPCVSSMIAKAISI